MARGSASAGEALDRASELLGRGALVALYPEGRLTTEPDLMPGPARTGAARLALRHPEVPVIPVGTWGPQQGHAHLWHRHTACLSVGPPVDLTAWIGRTEEAAARRVRDVIRQGYVEGRTVDQMARQLRGTRANGFKDGLLEVDRRGAEAIVRTAVTHTSNVASQEIYKSAGDFVEGWEFVATLDGRTTLTCASLDGKVYPIGKGPMPPRHIGCRSIPIPRLRGMGPTPRTSYAEWLRRQPAAAQDDILGASKGRLLRNGGLTVDRFTDRTGRVLTLDELRRRDASAFANAGL